MNRLTQWLAVAVLALTVSACAGMQGPQPANMTEAVYMANQYAIAAANTVNRLDDRGIIGDDTSSDLRDDLMRVKGALDDASSLAQAGDPRAAQARLDIARTVLTSVQDQLKEHVNERD